MILIMVLVNNKKMSDIYEFSIGYWNIGKNQYATLNFPNALIIHVILIDKYENEVVNCLSDRYILIRNQR